MCFPPGRRTGVGGKSVFELKPECEKECSPFFYHYTRMDHSKVSSWCHFFLPAYIAIHSSGRWGTKKKNKGTWRCAKSITWVNVSCGYLVFKPFLTILFLCLHIHTLTLSKFSISPWTAPSIHCPLWRGKEAHPFPCASPGNSVCTETVCRHVRDTSLVGQAAPRGSLPQWPHVLGGGANRAKLTLQRCHWTVWRYCNT